MTKDEFEKVVYEYGNDMFNFCCYLTLNRELASELYQETFLKAFELRNKIKKDGNIKSYLLSVAMNIWKNSVSKKMRRNKIAPTVDYEKSKEMLGDDKGEVLEEYIEKELIMEVKAAGDKLPDKQRMVVLLHYMGNESTESIARILHIPKGTVLSRLSKARENLRKEMEARGYEI